MSQDDGYRTVMLVVLEDGNKDHQLVLDGKVIASNGLSNGRFFERGWIAMSRSKLVEMRDGIDATLRKYDDWGD